MMIQKLFIEIIITFFNMAPYLLLGLTFAGVLHVLFSKEFVARQLGGNRYSSIIKAALWGVPLPLCSCGVVPTALSLRKKNASDGATLSFLISTPQTGIDSIVATYGMLGPVFAVFRPIAAFLMGIAGGFITNLFDTRKSDSWQSDQSVVSCNLCYNKSPHTHSFIEKIKGMIKYGYSDFLDDISKQLVVGITISGLISYFVPDDFFTRYIGNDFIEMLLMIVGGIPLYVCATASIPIALSLMIKGISPGAAFVFLAVGPATNAATITLITNAMGIKITIFYIGTISFFSIIAGYILNFIFDFFIEGGFKLRIIEKHVHSETSTYFIIGSIFLIMLILSLFRIYFPGISKKKLPLRKEFQANASEIRNIVINVEGMTCRNCVRRVSEAVYSVNGLTNVNVNLKQNSVAVSGSFDEKTVKEKIGEAGYKVV